MYIADGVDVWKLDDKGNRIKWIGRMDVWAATKLVDFLNKKTS